MGQKASDAAIACLCYECHTEIDQGNGSKLGKFAKWDAAHRETMRFLIENDYLVVDKK